MLARKEHRLYISAYLISHSLCTSEQFNLVARVLCILNVYIADSCDAARRNILGQGCRTEDE